MNCIVCNHETNHGLLGLGALCDSETCARIASRDLPSCDRCGDARRVRGIMPGIYTGDRHAIICRPCQEPARAEVQAAARPQKG